MEAGSASAWFAIAGALSGVLLTGLAGLAVALVNNRHARTMAELEQSQGAQAQRRQERREVYTDFLVASNVAYELAVDLVNKARDSGQQLNYWQETREAVGELMRTQLALALIGSPDVRAAAKEYAASLADLLVDATKAKWSDQTGAARHCLFASMIEDVQGVAVERDGGDAGEAPSPSLPEARGEGSAASLLTRAPWRG